MRDYLYIPLGGNRKGPRRAIVNLMIVFALSGLWHGAAWTFVRWGVFHGTFVALERIRGDRRAFLPLPLQHVTTLLLVLVGWVLFRAPTAERAVTMLQTMIGAGGATGAAPIAGYVMPRYA